MEILNEKKSEKFQKLLGIPGDFGYLKEIPEEFQKK